MGLAVATRSVPSNFFIDACKKLVSEWHILIYDFFVFLYIFWFIQHCTQRYLIVINS